MSLATMQQMEAVVMVASGPPAESLAIRSEPTAEPGPGEVCVEVHAAAVNPLDIANVLGLVGTPLPMIPGGDFAGTVVSGGDHVGEEVWGCGPALGLAIGVKRPGTHARFVTIPESWLSRKPESLTMVEAGAVGRAYWVAWHTVIDTMKLIRSVSPADHRRGRNGRAGGCRHRSLAWRADDHRRPS